MVLIKEGEANVKQYGNSRHLNLKSAYSQMQIQARMKERDDLSHRETSGVKARILYKGPFEQGRYS